MTNLSADAYRPHLDEIDDTLQYGLVGYTAYQSGSTAYTVYKGAVMMFDVDDVDGYAQPMLSSITASAGNDIFLGVAMEQVAVTSSDTANGSLTIEVGNGIFGFPVGSLAVTDIGAPAYASDDQTITTSSSNTLWVGVIRWVDSTYVWVDTRPAAGRLNTAT